MNGPTLELWTHAQKWDARERGYNVSFLPFENLVIAVFTNGEYYCYNRVFKLKGPEPGLSNLKKSYRRAAKSLGLSSSR